MSSTSWLSTYFLSFSTQRRTWLELHVGRGSEDTQKLMTSAILPLSGAHPVLFWRSDVVSSGNRLLQTLFASMCSFIHSFIRLSLTTDLSSTWIIFSFDTEVTQVSMEIGFPMGMWFPREWKRKSHFHGNGKGNRNDLRLSGNVEKYMVQKFPFFCSYLSFRNEPGVVWQPLSLIHIWRCRRRG